jgi:hypothetical protein
MLGRIVAVLGCIAITCIDRRLLFKGEEVHDRLVFVIFLLLAASMVVGLLSNSRIICIVSAILVLLHLVLLVSKDSIYDPRWEDGLGTLISPTGRMDPAHMKAHGMFLQDRVMSASELGFALERGEVDANVIFDEKTGKRPLHVAAGLARPDLARLLLRAGADADPDRFSGGTAGMNAPGIVT